MLLPKTFAYKPMVFSHAYTSLVYGVHASEKKTCANKQPFTV